MPRFVDINVRIYAFSAVPETADMQAVEQRLLRSAVLVISFQALQEFYNEVTRPCRSGRLSHKSAIEIAERLSKRPHSL